MMIFLDATIPFSSTFTIYVPFVNLETFTSFCVEVLIKSFAEAS